MSGVQGTGGFGPLEEAWFAAGDEGRIDADGATMEAGAAGAAARGGEGAAWQARLASSGFDGPDALVSALRNQPADELAQTLAAVKEEDPQAYRAALREVLNPLLAGKSRLVRHIMTIDTDNDGSLRFGESYKTMRDMGFTRSRTALLSAATALVFGPQTHGAFNMKMDVANSDKTQRTFFETGFDDNDQLDQRLDELMAYDQDGDGYVTLEDLGRVVDDRVGEDPGTGMKIIRNLNKSEWQALFSLTGGKMNREELRDFYEGSLFMSFLKPEDLAAKLVHLRESVGTPIGAADLSGHDAGPLPGLATLSAGPDAGPAAGAALGESMLLTPDPDSIIGNALMGGMAAMCPALAGGMG